MEVFPEEVAQRFGFPPDRRVINLILKDNYRNAEVELEFEGPSRGGNYTPARRNWASCRYPMGRGSMSIWR